MYKMTSWQIFVAFMRNVISKQYVPRERKLRQCRSIVGEKRDGALCRVTLLMEVEKNDRRSTSGFGSTPKFYHF